jgi:small subunit ribosomal protein S16
MAVKLRLARRGRKKLALYDVVVSDSRSPRDGKFIEKIGIYNPNTNPATIELNETRALHWVMVGAQPTDTVRAILSYKGVLLRKHLQLGVIKGAITQEQADAKFAAWLEAKNAKIEGKKSKLASDKASKVKSRIEAEKKVNAAREEAIKSKNKADKAPASEVTTVAEESAPAVEAASPAADASSAAE